MLIFGKNVVIACIVVVINFAVVKIEMYILVLANFVNGPKKIMR